MTPLHSALLAADESYLVGMSNKGLYKRAVKDLESGGCTVIASGETMQVSVSGETCTLVESLWESTCTCPSRSICRHILTAILFARSQLGDAEDEPDEVPEEAPDEPDAPPEEPAAPETETEPEPPVQNLPEEDVLQTVNAGTGLLSEILSWGLVRLPENMAEHLEAAAVQAHARRMADAERLFRDLGGQLQNLRSRRAVFRSEQFLHYFTYIAAHLEAIRTGRLSDYGEFRRTYEDYPGDLRLLALGEREVSGGEYEGKIYYFLNLDENAERRFLSFSDLRPVFYDSVKPRRGSVIPWNAGVPMAKLMESRLTLVGAKLSGGKLSSSQETVVAMRTKGNLDCDEVRRMIHTDLRELAVWLAGQDTFEETERLCLFCPSKCLASRFDTHAQQLRMTMEDAAGNHADLRVGFRKETKAFIEELERIGRIMLEKPEKDYVWLCLASFEDGELVLLPLEVYNFIQVNSPEPYRLPPHLEAKENAYAPQVLAFLEEAEEWLCELLQSGIRSAPERRGSELSEKAQRYGMEGFAGLLGELARQSEGFRHSMHADAEDAISALVQVDRYIRAGRDKLALICALNTMQQ